MANKRKSSFVTKYVQGKANLFLIQLRNYPFWAKFLFSECLLGVREKDEFSKTELVVGYAKVSIKHRALDYVQRTKRSNTTKIKTTFFAINKMRLVITLFATPKLSKKVLSLKIRNN